MSASCLDRTMRAFAAGLELHKDVVNRLNVYPVPDGDTGTNMSLTLRSVVAALDELELGAGAGEPAEMSAVCKAVSQGSLMGARGNSGVILCQVLRGIAATFAAATVGDNRVGPHEVALALVEAATAARDGVMRPVEGTILTVAADAAAAVSAADERGESTVVSLFEVAERAATESLWRTPDLLPVLAQAGVVDAGGAGLLLLYDAFLHGLDGRPMPEVLPLPPKTAEVVAAGVVAQPLAENGAGAMAGDIADGPRSGTGGAVGDLRYEVMYFLEAPDAAIRAFKQVWAGIGDSIVVVGGEGLWNCHIHTDDIGASIEAALDAGRPRDIRVTDLLDQVEEESWVRRASEQTPVPPPDDGPAPVTSVVAVATGEGIQRIFYSLGVRHIVAGGQSMNPSTAQILEVVESVPGRDVVILPNNKNIYAVAKQVSELSTKSCLVVDTQGIQEGFAALLEYDPDSSGEENARAMQGAAGRVLAGEVTRAVRPSESAAGHIDAGDWIGLSRGGIESVAPTLAGATIGLLGALLGDRHEIVTLIEGAGANAADTRRVTEWLRENRPDVTLEMHHGGQPLYPYLVSVE